MDCDAAKVCVKQSDCIYNGKLTLKHLDKFLYTDDECDTTLIYFKKNKPSTLSTLYMKTIKQRNNTCNICYSYDNNYYYIYRDLIYKLISFRNGTQKKIVGNHLSIGYNNNGWDIHDTIYETASVPTNNNLIYFLNRTNYVYYKINENKNEIKLPANFAGQDNYFEENKIFWNDFVCFTKSQTGRGPKTKLAAPKPSKKIEPKKVRQRREPTPDSSDSPESDEPVLNTSKEYADLIIERLKLAYNTGKKYMIVKIPYIRKTIQKRVAELVKDKLKSKFKTVFVINRAGSFISLNIL